MINIGYDLISRKFLLEQYGLKDCKKYGNKTTEEQEHSFDTLMMYEIAWMIEDAPVAFDVEKIIEKLEFLREAYRKKFDEQYSYIALITYGRIESIDICLRMIINELKRNECEDENNE